MIKCNIKAFFVGGLISLVITVSATIILHSNQVEYNDNKSVETAVNELYQKADECRLLDKLEMKKIGCDGCTKLEYIESTESQYIDTGIYGKSSMEFNCEFDIINGASYYYLFGANNNSFTGYPGIFVSVIDNNQNNSLTWRYGSSTIEKTGLILNLGIKHKISLSYRIIRVDEIEYSAVNSVSWNDINYSIYIFAANLQGNNYNRFTNIKLYNFKIYDNNVLICDYIPVLDSSKRPCLFDKVSKTYFYNQGNGDDFLYG